jgi:hypothetical protein
MKDYAEAAAERTRCEGPLLPPLKKGTTGDLLLILLQDIKSNSPSIPLFQRGETVRRRRATPPAPADAAARTTRSPP